MITTRPSVVAFQGNGIMAAEQESHPKTVSKICYRCRPAHSTI